jgi:hypothetical protein
MPDIFCGYLKDGTTVTIMAIFTQPVTIHLQPIDYHIIDFIETPSSILLGYGKFSEAEYDADFYVLGIDDLYRFFKEHLFLKWRYKKFDKITGQACTLTMLEQRLQKEVSFI